MSIITNPTTNGAIYFKSNINGAFTSSAVKITNMVGTTADPDAVHFMTNANLPMLSVNGNDGSSVYGVHVYDRLTVINRNTGNYLKFDAINDDAVALIYHQVTEPAYDQTVLLLTQIAGGQPIVQINELYINGGGNCNIYTKTECDNKFQPKPEAASQTITHVTNVIYLDHDVTYGVFCETNGGIYDGYAQIGPTDCICKVQPTKVMSNKIVGIIVSENANASHGDVLCKDIPGTYALGDILAPDVSGLCRKATDEEKLGMIVNAVPRPKITSLITGIENTVACFIV
jgi:hypothetical protein